MSTTVEQLLTKALSTPSEDEAISCLRMARKRGESPKFDDPAKVNTFKGGTIEHWYNQTYEYYGYAKKYKGKCEDLNKTVLQLNSKLMWYNWFIIPSIVGISFILCLALLLI